MCTETVLEGIGIAAGRHADLSGLLSAGPLLACARCNGRITALVSVYAIGLCAIAAEIAALLDSPIQGECYGMIAMSGVLAVFIAIIRGRRERRLIMIADRVQRAILRPLPAEVGGVAFASRYQSATPGTLVGGDLYDLTMTRFGPRLIIGDVKGKGLDAVGRCAAVIATFRELAFSEEDLTKLAEQMDARLSPDMGIEDFVTIILAEFGAGEVRLANCGHHPPVKAGPGDDPGAGPRRLELVSPERPAPPLGLHPRPARQDVALKQGDRLLFYTDGLVDARDRAGRFLELDGRVAAALAAPGLDTCVRQVAGLLLEHAGSTLGDDVLLVVAEPLNLAGRGAG